MTEPVDVARDLYRAVAEGDRDAVSALLATDVRWIGRERGPRWRRTRLGCSGRGPATASMLLMGRKLPTLRPVTFERSNDGLLVGLAAETMEGETRRWWTRLYVEDRLVVTIKDQPGKRRVARRPSAKA